ncbi:MAG: Alanine--tRNA ligase [Chlamydiia bacterium]|nr:Alanine--tRNA ligase [Chlamydiia bacterium]MCH9614967.1 Alanine--tRNA ligase [Chlamydiia bacterium]MCH9629983.1 Alanine--tRNA ligase [Chlamydiia bacterium]
MSTHEIRNKFLKAFKSAGHTIVPSAPVVPHDDPTLLFNNAGMNQFKDVFLGESKRDYTRAVTSQKCVRVGGKHNDLDNVGHTTRHMTFFEMLGNFSFGDYFKKEAIEFAWNISIDVFGFDKSKLVASVFQTDDEAYSLWQEYLPEDQIIRLGEKDNFWSMGDTGPCGPCSELLYDRGDRFEGDERYLEYWNLVFMQYNRDKNGKKHDLPRPSIDTGAGLERIRMLQMGVDTVFETDILRNLIAEIENLTGQKYAGQPAFHVIADHMRTLAFAIADGATPSNVDRGYVLRKLLRRAVRYGKLLGLNNPFLAKLLPRLISEMGETYHELSDSKARIEELVTLEEESFFRTLKRGGNLLNQVIENTSHEITGDDAFKLKDTYGFPLEEILLIAKDANLSVNLEQFGILEEQAKERSRGARDVDDQKAQKSLFEGFADKHGSCHYTGFEETNGEGTVIAIISDGKFVETLESGQKGMVILDRTPFYAEKGGQIGDIGDLSHQNARFKVEDTRSPFPGVIGHVGTLERGIIMVGEPLLTQIDFRRRDAIARNHTATHLLHWALQEVLGSHIRQAGSLVEPRRLRFDFNHHKPLTHDQIIEVERMVNGKIWENNAVNKKVISYAEAQKDPSIKQFFGDKYGDEVRVVSIGGFSKELCGGVHVDNAGTIGLFRIAKESSIAKGVRRIEAAVGLDAETIMYQGEQRIFTLADKLGVPTPKIEERVDRLLEEYKQMKESLRAFRKSELANLKTTLLSSVKEVNGHKVLAEKVSVEADELAPLANDLLEHMGSGALILALEKDGRAQLLIKVSKDLVKKGIEANALIKKVGPLIQGGGGGKPDSAQAGGKDPSGIDNALETFLSSL